jgi:hypothetical protein
MRLGAAVGVVVLSLLPVRARAAGAVLGHPGETPTLKSVRVAVAIAPGRSTLWAQVSVAGASSGFAWLLPVRPGARIDLASDAWLDALDAATIPVLLEPSGSGDAGTTCDAGAPDIAPATTSPQSMRPAATGVFADAATLGTFLAGSGYALPDDLANRLATFFASGSAVLAETYSSDALPARTTRITDTGPPILPFAWSGPAAAITPVTAFVVASAAATAGTSPLGLDPATLVWAPDDASTYANAAQVLLVQAAGARWLTESAQPGILFQGAALAPLVSLPAVVPGYFQLAAAYGDGPDDAATCAAAADAAQVDAGPFGSVCPPGALGVVAGPSPCSPAADDAGDEGGNDASDEGAESVVGPCGTEDDAALALASLGPSGVWVTRVAGVLETASANDVAVSAETGPVVPSIVVAGGPTVGCTPSPAASSPPAASNDLGSVTPSTPYYPPASGGSSSSAPGVASGVADGCGSAAGVSSDNCSNDDPSSGDGTDAAGSGCGSADPGGDDCAAAGRTRTRGRSPFSRIVVVMVSAAAIARRRDRRRGNAACSSRLPKTT